jgi:hypothetical protein
MSEILPNRFLFKFEFPLYRCARPPRIDGRVDEWSPRWRLPPLHSIDDPARPPGFASVYVTWNDDGLYVGCQVEGKSRSPRCDPKQFWKGDNLRLMTDMRDTRDIRRATRFCQHFYFLPLGGGSDGSEPVAGSAKVHRATQDAPLAPAGSIVIASRVHHAGYSLTAHVPARGLAGFDPAENPRIGLYYMVEDAELGQQYLTVGDDFNWWVDQSTWATALLTE